MEEFQISILAADHPFYEGPCISLVVPTLEGMYGFMAGHLRMISSVVPGILHYTLPDGTKRYAAVSEGIIKCEDNKILVLVDTAERPEDIDANRAKLAADKAKEKLLQKRSLEEYHVAQANLARAMNRLKVHKNHREDGGGF